MDSCVFDINVVAQRAMKNKCGSSEQKEHWLYYADDKYDVSTTLSALCMISDYL